MPCSRPPQVGSGIGRNCITSGQVHGSKAGSDLWALSQELLNELNLNPLPQALASLSGDFMTPSCKVRGISLLEFVGSTGSNGTFEECSLVPGT